MIEPAPRNAIDGLQASDAFPYRWSTRAIMLDKTDATKLLSKIRRQWFAKRKSVAAILKEVMTNEASVLTDSDAANKAADADLALQELGADTAGIAYVTATVTVWDKDPALATEKLRQVEKVIQGRDFTCMVEGLNAVEAWLGSLPGQVYANVRQPPVSTLNLAHMIPLSALWAGAERDEHFSQPALFHARTEGSTPFRFSLHVGDVGHALVVGPTGAGKSEPDYRIVSRKNGYELGAGWKKFSQATGAEYVSVVLSAPEFGTIYGNVANAPGDDPSKKVIIWNPPA